MIIIINTHILSLYILISNTTKTAADDAEAAGAPRPPRDGLPLPEELREVRPQSANINILLIMITIIAIIIL